MSAYEISPNLTTRCCRCDGTVIIEGASLSLNSGNWATVLRAPWLIDLREVFCARCLVETSDLLDDDAPEHDDESNYVIANHYAGI
jgi:hypothetical protein